MRKLLVAMLVLVVLVVGADIAGRAYAESRAATEIGRRTDGAAPSVTIHGLSFLVQALPGHYRHVTLSAPGLTVGPIIGIAATVELTDVDFPLTDALHGNTDNLVAGRAALRAVLSTSQLTAALARTGAVVTAAADGTIRVSTTVSVAGRVIAVSGDLVASFSSGVLHLDPTGFQAAGVSVPGLDSLLGNLSLSLPLGNLPFAVQTASLGTSGTDLVLTATADGVRLHPLG